VFLDGQEVGAIAYPPHELHVSGAIKAGRHTLSLQVAGNMKNLLGPHFSDGLPILWQWQVHGESRANGDEYRFFPSGLMQEPAVQVWG
jgi:hypothetical protein